MASSRDKTIPILGSKVTPGAESQAMCLSCNTTYPAESTECPKCQVSLSLVRKCPSCGRIQAAQHPYCLSCSTALVREVKLEASLPPLNLPPPQKTGGHRVKGVLTAGVVLGTVSTILLYNSFKDSRKSEETMGQSEVLRQVSVHQRPLIDSPLIKDLQPPDTVTITDYTIDLLGNRWFRISFQGFEGYVRTDDVAPPKGRDSEKSYELLRHWLLGLDNPALLAGASTAVDGYGKSFAGNTHFDELAWLLAEATRRIAERSGQPHGLLASARKRYETLARGSGEFADEARQALAQLSPGQRSGGSSHSARDHPFIISIEGGTLTSSPGSRAEPSRNSGRLVTVLSTTPMFVRFNESVRVAPGVTFQGNIEQDIYVNNELAIPKGSLCHLTIVGGSPASQLSNSLAAVTFRLDAVTIHNQTYKVSAVAVHIRPPGKSGPSTPDSRLPIQLPAGTWVEFRLSTPLVITHS